MQVTRGRKNLKTVGKVLGKPTFLLPPSATRLCNILDHVTGLPHNNNIYLLSMYHVPGTSHRLALVLTLL